VGRLRFLDAAVEATTSSDGFIFSGSFRVIGICFFEGAAGWEPEECINEFDETTRKQEAPASLAVEVFISV